MKLSDLFQYGNKSRQSSGPEAVSQSARVSSAASRHQQAVKGLTPGQTIHGEVVSKNGSEIQIRLDGNTVINARLEKDLNVTPGQNMTFEVKNNSGAQVALRPLYENLSRDPNVLRALEAARLSSTEPFMRMVASMMEQGMSIDRNSVLSMSRLVTANPSAAPETLVALKNLQFPVTPENIEQFEAYRDYEHQLLNGVKDILSKLSETCQYLTQNGREDEAVKLYQQVLKLFAGENADGARGSSGVPSAEEPAMQEKTGGEAAGLLDKGSSTAPAGGERIIFTEQSLSEEAFGNGTSPAGEETGSGAVKAEAAFGMEAAEVASGRKEAEAVEGRAAQQLSSPLTDGTIFGLSGDGMNTLVHLLRKAGFPPEQLAFVKNGSAGAEQILKEIAILLTENREQPASSAMRDLLGSREFGQLLDSRILSQWLLKPQDVAKKDSVEEFYARLKEQTARLTESLGHIARDTPLAKSLTTVQNNLDFMNQLNQLYQYVQLPLKMSGGEAHGDLYVYTNRKSQAKQDGSVSALLHLDMEHLGALDVYVTMREQQVGTRFYLQDEDTLDLVAEHISLLEERLKKRGYSLNSEMLMNEQAGDQGGASGVLETLAGGENKDPRLSTCSFDARA